ncbi:SDR family oxidoreductase [Leucobacter sp. CSA2]|uniref:SDR family oxidoreductase n=1 Tax=Leucobacter edaphi TaxID=2796472 RepID=A0A934QCH3_9MICO|nr:SDR family oxidoreductase [Leucobacter edaphi]
MKLEGKTAIVTGSARGIGGAIARAYQREGANVVYVDRPGQFSQEATDSSILVEADLMDPGSAVVVVEKALGAFGGIDVLVNCAQASTQKLFIETAQEDWDLAFGTGLWATVRLMQEAYPALKAAHGSVINFASGAGITGQVTQAAYGANKEAIRGLSRVTANEWAADGIRVNVMSPFALSEGVEAYFAANPEAGQAAAAKTPLGRVGDLDRDIAPVAVFLASDDSRYMTGQTLMVDGGQVMLR